MVSKEEIVTEFVPRRPHHQSFEPFNLYYCLGVHCPKPLCSAQSGAGRLTHLLYELNPSLSLPYSSFIYGSPKPVHSFYIHLPRG